MRRADRQPLRVPVMLEMQNKSPELTCILDSLVDSSFGTKLSRLAQTLPAQDMLICVSDSSPPEVGITYICHVLGFRFLLGFLPFSHVVA